MIRREFLAGLTGLSALAAAPAISFAQTPMNLGQQWDVIVIGSGLAGLSAALSASENGADRILVIEKLPVLGGHSRLSTGSFLAVSPKRLEPLGIHTSVDAVLEEMMEVGGGIGNKDLARLLLSQSDAAMDWLETHGLVWNPEPYVAVGSPSAYAFRTIQGFTGSHYIFKLNQRARERGVRFLYDQPVTDLLQDPVSGNVNGVVVKSKNHEVIYIRGNAVVIASDIRQTTLYAANSILKSRRLCPRRRTPEEDILTELGAMRWNSPNPSTQQRLIWIRFKRFASWAAAWSTTPAQTSI